MAVESRLQLQPYDTTVRYYVDGTNGLDGALGTSWATAWKTLEYATKRIRFALISSPVGLSVYVHVRGLFGASDDLDLDLSGGQSDSCVAIGCDYNDCVVIKGDPAVAVVAATALSHGLVEVQFSGAVVLAAGDAGSIVRFTDGTDIGTYRILRVDAATNTATISITATLKPAWLIAGVSAELIESAAIIQGRIRVSSHTGAIPFFAAGDGVRCALVNLRAYLMSSISGNRIATALDLRNAAGTAQSLEAVSSVYGQSIDTESYITQRDLVSEYGYASAAGASGGDVCLGNRCSSYWLGRADSATGCFVTTFNFSQTNTVVKRSRAEGITSQQSASSIYNSFLTPQSTASRPAVKVGDNGRSAGMFVKDVWIGDLVVGGYAASRGLIQVKHGGFVYLWTSSGNNTGTAVSGLFGLVVEPGGVAILDASSSSSIKGKHGRYRCECGKLVFLGNASFDASEGGGPDMYLEDADLDLRGTFEKTATNPSGGGTAQPIMTVRRRANVTQDTTKTFTLPAGSGNNTTDYGANGAIDIETCCDVALGTLAGGNAAATNTAVRVKRASRLAHAGGAPTWGAAALDQGGNAAAAMPAAVTSDMAAGVPEDCWVLPNSA